MILILLIIALFWAINMGASGFAVSFAPSVGSNLLRKNKALFLFTMFVLLGSILVGERVAKTLSSKIIPTEFITPFVALIILFSACASLFLANILKIPQSTSIITVGSFIGAGLYFKSLNIYFIIYLISVWITIPILSYFVTYFLAKKIYPPRLKNLYFYEKIFRHKDKLIAWTLLTNCYSAFGIGTNNVANVVGPLMGAKVINPLLGFVIFSILFGLGGFILGRGVLKTVSEEIVPLGVASASLISFVITTFIIICSILGFPAPYVQFSSLSILAMHTVKEEKNHIQTLAHPISRKILKVWIFTPLLSIVISYLLLYLFGV